MGKASGHLLHRSRKGLSFMVPNHFVGSRAFVEQSPFIRFAQADDLFEQLFPDLGCIVLFRVEKKDWDLAQRHVTAD